MRIRYGLRSRTRTGDDTRLPARGAGPEKTDHEGKDYSPARDDPARMMGHIRRPPEPSTSIPCAIREGTRKPTRRLKPRRTGADRAERKARAFSRFYRVVSSGRHCPVTPDPPGRLNARRGPVHTPPSRRTYI